MALADENGKCAEMSPRFAGQRRISLLHEPFACQHCGRCGCAHMASYGPWNAVWCEDGTLHFVEDGDTPKFANPVMVPISWHYSVIR